ncbi:MAG: hypothetical protein ACK5NG_11410 [Chthoniobacterales bacterium]
MAAFLNLLRAILSDFGTRRRYLGALTLLLLIVFFIGAVPLAALLEASPALFVIYWLACIWLLITVTLLALYDLLQVFRKK